MGDQIWVKIEDIDMTNPYDERYVLTINIYMYNRYIGEIFFEDNEEDMYLLYYRFENFYKFGFLLFIFKYNKIWRLYYKL